VGDGGKFNFVTLFKVHFATVTRGVGEEERVKLSSVDSEGVLKGK
jgi:hypothetical protein